MNNDGEMDSVRLAMKVMTGNPGRIKVREDLPGLDNRPERGEPDGALDWTNQVNIINNKLGDFY